MKDYMYRVEGNICTDVMYLKKVDFEELVSIVSHITIVVEDKNGTSFRTMNLVLGRDSFAESEDKRYYVEYKQDVSNYINYKKDGLYELNGGYPFYGEDYKSAILNCLRFIFGGSDISIDFMFREGDENYERVISAFGK